MFQCDVYPDKIVVTKTVFLLEPPTATSGKLPNTTQIVKPISIDIEPLIDALVAEASTGPLIHQRRIPDTGSMDAVAYPPQKPPITLRASGLDVVENSTPAAQALLNFLDRNCVLK